MLGVESEYQELLYGQGIGEGRLFLCCPSVLEIHISCQFTCHFMIVVPSLRALLVHWPSLFHLLLALWKPPPAIPLLLWRQKSWLLDSTPLSNHTILSFLLQLLPLGYVSGRRIWSFPSHRASDSSEAHHIFSESSSIIREF